MERIPMTLPGLEKLKKELSHLKGVERPRVVNEIEVAREHGDLSENAEYHAAKEKLGHVDGRIQHLELRISKVEVIDPQKMKGIDRVMFGAHVTIMDLNVEKEITYQIVGEDESDISSGQISVSSPVGRALIGKKKKDTVKVQTPKGAKEFEIIEVEYR